MPQSSHQDKEALIIQLTDDYKQRKLQGEDPDLQAYMETHPEVAEEIKADIEAWEWLHQMAGTWDFLAAFPSVEETLAAIRPRLEEVRKEQLREAATTVQWRRLGQFSKIRRLSPRPSAMLPIPSLQRVAAKSQRSPAEGTDAESLTEDAEITADVFIDHRRHIIGWLQGPKGKIAHIPVSLWKEQSDGSGSILSDFEKETDELGRVDFGPVEEIPQAEEKGYILKAIPAP